MKKGQVNVGDILPLALTITVAGVGIAFGLNVMNDVQEDFVSDTAGCNSSHKTSCGADYNATEDGIVGVGKFSSKFGLIATVIVASIVIGLLVRFLFVR